MKHRSLWLLMMPVLLIGWHASYAAPVDPDGGRPRITYDATLIIVNKTRTPFWVARSSGGKESSGYNPTTVGAGSSQQVKWICTKFACYAHHQIGATSSELLKLSTDTLASKNPQGHLSIAPKEFFIIPGHGKLCVDNKCDLAMSPENNNPRFTLTIEEKTK